MEKELKKINDKLDFIINNYPKDRTLQDSEHKVKNRKYKTLINNIYKKIIDLYFLVDEENHNNYEVIVDKFVLVYVNLVKINIINTPSRRNYIYYIGIPIKIQRGEKKFNIISFIYKENEILERFINHDNIYTNRIYSKILLFSNCIEELIYNDKNVVLLYWLQEYINSFKNLSFIIDFEYSKVILSDDELINFKKLTII